MKKTLIAIVQTIKNRFAYWRSCPARLAVLRVYSAGHITSHQLHEIDAAILRHNGHVQPAYDGPVNHTPLGYVAKAICILALSCVAVAAKAQTNIPSFFDTAQSYLTTFNPAFTWTNVTIEASTGLKQVTGSGATDVAQVQYDFGRWNAGAVIGFEGVGSTVGTVQAQGGYAVLEHFDTKVDLDVQGGYSWYHKAYMVEPELAISKKLTANTFARIGVSIPLYSKGSQNRTPSFEVGAGFTF